MQPQREPGTGQPQHDRDRDDQARPSSRAARQGGEKPSCTHVIEANGCARGGEPSGERRAGYSMPSGPADSPDRNWRTNGFSEANSSCGRAGFDDSALPQDGDVLGHPARAADVVGDHHVAATVLGVDLLDQLAQQRRAHRVKARVGLVEQHDFRFEHQRPREARALAHAPGELVGHLVALVAQTHLAQARG